MLNIKKETEWLLKEKYPSTPLRTGFAKNIQKDIKRLKMGEPIDYVIGFAEFLGCKIDLSKKPLIPRTETEYWVGEVISKIKNGAKVLDVFAGSGCIGIALLKNKKELLCDFTDKSIEAVKQIKINCKINGIDKKRYKVFRTDVFRRLYPSTSLRAKYDFIFANPPYIPKNKQNRIQKSVLKFEPALALFGGKDGLFFINKFLREAKRYLNPGGIIFVEFSPEQKINIEKLIKKYNYKTYEFSKDQFNRWRWVKIEN